MIDINLQSAVRSSVESIWGLPMEILSLWRDWIDTPNRYHRSDTSLQPTGILVLHKVGCGKHWTIMNIYLKHYMNPIYWNWHISVRKELYWLHWWIFKAASTLPLFTSSQTSCFWFWCFCWYQHVEKVLQIPNLRRSLPWQPRLVRSSSTKPRRF